MNHRNLHFTLVEADLGAALQIGIQNPVDHKQHALDAADFPQGRREFVLTWIGGEFPQDLAGRNAPGCDGGSDAQDVGPVTLDHDLVDLSADQGPQMCRRRRRLERIEPLGRKIPDPQDEAVAENGASGEDVIGETARVGEPLADMAAGIVHEQAVEDIGRFARRRGDHLGANGAYWSETWL